MLAPVARHESQAHKSERNQKDKDCCASVNITVHKVQENVVAPFAHTSLERKVDLTGANKVHGQVEPNEEIESTDVLREIPNTIPLIPDSGREVIGSVAFHMMVLDVVIVIRVPGMTHERIQDVREGSVD